MVENMKGLKLRLNQVVNRMTQLERQVVSVHENLAHHFVHLDRINECLERIEKRLELVEA